MREHLEALKAALEQFGATDHAALVAQALAGSETELAAFLVSNELWGGAGSIADEAGMGGGRGARRAIEKALVRLGDEQIRAGTVNRRTRMWVETFGEWDRKGI